jgi:hypothetical protein
MLSALSEIVFRQDRRIAWIEPFPLAYACASQIVMRFFSHANRGKVSYGSTLQHYQMFFGQALSDVDILGEKA